MIIKMADLIKQTKVYIIISPFTKFAKIFICEDNLYIGVIK